MEFDIEKCQYFDDMPTPFCAIEVLDYERHDPDNYIIRYSNNAHNDLIGLTKEEIEDHSFWYDRKFLHSEETILKMPAFMRAPKQDDYWKKSI